MTSRRNAQRLHGAMRDVHCPVCGQVIYRTHRCRGRPPESMTPDELKAAAAMCRDAIRKHAGPRPVQGGLFDV